MPPLSDAIAARLGNFVPCLSDPSVALGRSLHIAVDTLVEGIHFPVPTPAADVGYKALAVNLSDLAAMGAEPLCADVALTLPSRDMEWATAFADGLGQLCRTAGMAYRQIECSHGALAVTVAVLGTAPRGDAILRSGARFGDGIYVSGELGGAALALSQLTGEMPGPCPAELRQRLDRPTPRLGLGVALRGLATSAIDLSDGLASDLSHLLRAGSLGASVQLKRLPLAGAVREAVSPEAAWRYAIAGGDDYELCFTAPDQSIGALERLPGCPVTRIGAVEPEPGLRLLKPDGSLLESVEGYQHFKKRR